MPKRIAIKLKPATERMVKKGHPWVFDKGIIKQSEKGQSGDLAIIFDTKKNKFLACGLYDPNSPIRIKVLQVHESATIDSEWFKQKVQKAYNIRKPLIAGNTNSYRLIHGENDGLPSCVVDIYDKVLVIKLYSAIWFPYLDEILPHLLTISQCETAVLRLSRSVQSLQNNEKYKDGQILVGELANEEVLFKEHGLLFSANVIKGHKTGYFLDHRHNRRKVGEMAKGKTVLDLFSYAGGFSVHALAKGAKAVTSLDVSAQALELAKKNVALNPHNGFHTTMAMDVFDGLNLLLRKKEYFDIVIIDPPSFAKKASEIEKAKESYKRLVNSGAKLVRKGGILVMASCSSRILATEFFELVQEVLESQPKRVKLFFKTDHDIDHPVNFTEGAYLKCGYYKIG